VGWLERQNETTQAWMKKQPTWHTYEVILIGLCGVLIGVISAKICMWLVHLSMM